MHVAKPRKWRRLSARGNNKICSDINGLIVGCGGSLARTGLRNRVFPRFLGLKFGPERRFYA
jgi:hypothetical protein